MSANTPMPVPSKAALRALRGIVLGTSCTLALITEDRRRRINTARSAIHNGDRIRSARRYHSDSSALASALEKESLSVEPDAAHWQAADVESQHRGILAKTTAASSAKAATRPDLLGRSSSMVPSQQRLSSIPSLVQQAEEYKSRMRHISRPENAAPADVAAAEHLVDLPAAIARLVELTSAGNPANLEAAVKVFRSTAPSVAVSSESDQPISAGQLQALWDASSALCRACQDAGRMDLAQDVLRLAILHEQLDEAAYLAHNPLAVVASMIPADVPIVARGGGGESSSADAEAQHDAVLKQLRDAVLLFLPRMTGPRSHPVDEFVPLARQLLECAFAVNSSRLIKSVFASMVAYTGEMSEFLHWYICRLHQGERYKLVVWAYLARSVAAAPLSTAKYLELGDCVAGAARLTNSSKAGEILRALATVRSSDRVMRTSWVTELLHCQWRTGGQDYEAVQQRFAELVSSKGGLAARVHHPDGVYRVMVQIALEAGRPAEAESYFDELKATSATAAGDIRLLGLFALQQAKQGDWDGVRSQLEAAVTAAATAAGGRGLEVADAERVFVPIVKEYTQTHTIGETEDFLKSYIAELGMPVGRRMVTLLANEYGALREVQSFVGWLEYCAQAGFTVDAAFSNAILNSCRKHWKFGFRDLRTMYRKLCVLSPNFEDRVTKTIMTHAAISDAKYMGRPVKGRILSLHAGPARSSSSSSSSRSISSSAGFVSPLSTAGRHLDEESLYLSMKQAFASGNVVKVVRVYRMAVRGGMMASERCLKLAVAAAVRSGHGSGSGSGHGRSSTAAAPTQFDTAIELLQAAQTAGLDIDAAAAYVAVACIDVEGPAASARRGRNGAAAAVQSILRQLEASDVRVSDMALNRAAFTVFKAGHMRSAVALALSAANTPVGGRRPGYNVWNFSVLAAAYARLADAEGLAMAVEGAAAGRGVLGQLMAYKVLKQARRRLRAVGGGFAGGESSGDSCEYSARWENNYSDRVENSATVENPARWESPATRTLLVVEDGLARARLLRRQLGSQRLQVEVAALDIMRRAALDAGCDPVDFDDVPFLHRRLSADSSLSAADDADGFVSSPDWELPHVTVASPAERPAPLVACPT